MFGVDQPVPGVIAISCVREFTTLNSYISDIERDFSLPRFTHPHCEMPTFWTFNTPTAALMPMESRG